MNAREALAAILVDDPDAAPPISEALLDAAGDEGVDALVASSRGLTAAAPPEIVARCAAILREAEARALVQDRETRRVIDGLAIAGLPHVAIKGAHLAHALYPTAALRPRGDTDLVIAPVDRDRAAAILHSLGYDPAVHVRGTVIFGQSHFLHTDASGVTHALDVHWRIAAPLVLRRVLPLETLLARAIPIPALGPNALGPSSVDALLISCIHVAVHHRDHAFLIWLYDILALAAALRASEIEQFVAEANAAQVGTLCRAAIDRAGELFRSTRLRDLSTRLALPAAVEEPSAALLAASRPFDDLWLDLRVSDGWSERLTLLKEHAWPDAGYMRAVDAGAWLPLAYARRLVRGARRWTRPSGPRRTAAPDAPPAGSAAASSPPAPSRTSR